MSFLRNKHHHTDPLWHVQLVLIGIIVLQLLLPDRLSALPKYVLPIFELICLVGLQLTTPKEAVFNSKFRRFVAIALIIAVAVANLSSLEVLLQLIFTSTEHDAIRLLSSAASVYLTNVVIFGLLFWEMDAGGPGQRRRKDIVSDFVFPQQSMNPKTHWHPTFADYLYISVTNATAFSPTDTMPLSRRAKMAMGLQAFISLVVVALVAARAVNIL